MPKTIPSSAAPNIAVRPASIVNLNSLSIALLPLFVAVRAAALSERRRAEAIAANRNKTRPRVLAL
jgi:hypothetical protein